MRKLTSEFLGTFLLALAIVGAGAMATSITQDGALRLFINAITAMIRVNPRKALT